MQVFKQHYNLGHAEPEQELTASFPMKANCFSAAVLTSYSDHMPGRESSDYNH